MAFFSTLFRCGFFFRKLGSDALKYVSYLRDGQISGGINGMNNVFHPGDLETVDYKVDHGLFCVGKTSLAGSLVVPESRSSKKFWIRRLSVNGFMFFLKIYAPLYCFFNYSINKEAMRK